MAIYRRASKSNTGIHTVCIGENANGTLKEVKIENRNLFETEDPEIIAVLDNDPEVEKMRKSKNK